MARVSTNPCGEIAKALNVPNWERSTRVTLNLEVGSLPTLTVEYIWPELDGDELSRTTETFVRHPLETSE